MRILLILAALGGAGYLGRQWLQRRAPTGNAAFDPDQPQGDHRSVRDAGPAAMRDPPRDEWTEADQASDESFPASDPPATY